ncbi:WecB/TagA/CpsF family glycosyltransferase [Alienimonas chondri]|uniref:UDP-N-acetyl-D-mannosaminuronic acid transferase n=1 Tax=Alienimonas chondri TaxID=2681879 RepID=A0ABX1V9W4_9PLAN|nr:WecB/TagA/CpsF family glycosyltransferase [Alienimonas chondri]NNJ24558.1 UDP-N-acetyl-D-mannosaminuronic acid transferase [Alienimonas chondri]
MSTLASPPAPAGSVAVDRPVTVAPATSVPPVPLFGLRLDPVTLGEAIARIHRWVDDWRDADRPSGGTKVVVTPNVDHLVKLHRTADPLMVEAYRAADLTLADGTPVVAASRWFGKPVPERVPGSDLVPSLLASANAKRPLRVFLLGAGPGVAEIAAANIARDTPHAEVVGTHCPPLGFERNPQENELILALLEEAKPDVLIVGLGFPKQEKWVHAHREALTCGVALCVGATIDFLAGNVTRAPRWLGRVGLEWVFRLGLEPKRLAGRYANDLVHFPRVLWREWRRTRAEGDRSGDDATIRP